VIDKIISYFLFFMFLFFLLFNLKDLLIQEKEENFKEKLQIKTETFLIKKFEIYDCYQILESNKFDIIKYNENFNPKINGYTLVTEELFCYFNHDDTFKTEVNYSLI